MVAVFVLDKRLRCDFINAVAETLVGLSLSQAKGRPFADVLWRGSAASFGSSEIGRLLRTHTAGEGEEVVDDSKGGSRPCAFRVSPLGSEVEGGSVVEITDLSGEVGIGKALRESEERLRLAVAATGIGTWDVNVITGERRWSPEFRKILGLSADAQPDVSVFESLIHPLDRDRVNALYEQAYQVGSSGTYHAEFRIRRADDGAERWVSTSGRVTFDADGHPIRGIGTLRDIDEGRRYEEALREREERLRVALVAGRMGTWRHDIKTGEQQWDETQSRLLGVSPSVTPTRELFLALVHPDDLRKVSFDDPIPVGTYLDSEFRIRRADTGEERWISAQAFALADSSGEAIELIGVNRDITARKEADATLRYSEERQRLATEANGVGTWDIDMLTGQHRWSQQFKRLWGLPDDAEPTAALLKPLLDRDVWSSVLRQWGEATDPGKGGRVSIEFQGRRADNGEVRWFSFSGQIFFDEAFGKPIRGVGIMLDVTERKEAEERQRVILKELNHRVKNTLAVVQAIVSQTLRLSKPGEAFERIQARLMAVARTHDFLHLAHWHGVAFADLLRGELEPYAGAGDPRLAIGGPSVVLDSKSALALGLTFHELATNAAKYGALSQPAGHLEIRWTVAPKDEGVEVRLSWEESGGPTVRTPRKTGFGTRLIEGSVRGNLNGSVTFNYARRGLVCKIVFPLREQFSI
jgi:PAS domain S-box-containing protein